MQRFLLVATLFASTPAIAQPALNIEGEPELVVEKKALQKKIYGESSGIGFTFCSAFVRGFTLGLSEIVMHQFSDDDFPVFDDASKINPRTSAAGTVLGIIVLAGIVYSLLELPVSRRLAARKARRSIPAVKRPYEPGELDVIVGAFVTRDGYEFVVMRYSRKPDNLLN